MKHIILFLLVLPTVLFGQRVDLVKTDSSYVYELDFKAASTLLELGTKGLSYDKLKHESRMLILEVNRYQVLADSIQTVLEKQMFEAKSVMLKHGVANEELRRRLISLETKNERHVRQRNILGGMSLLFLITLLSLN